MTTALATRENGEIVLGDGEVVDLRHQPTALEALTRAEIDSQVATAKRYPRSPARFVAEARTMIALSPEIAAQCTYKLPARRGEGGKGGGIEGPSVRLAEIVAATWGNLRIVGRIVEDDGRMITAQGVALDLERNLGYQVEVKRRVTTRDGRRFSDDMVIVTCNAAIAIATRNATFKAVPRAFVTILEEEAKQLARGDVKSLPERLDRALAWFASKGAAEPKVLKALGVNGRADVTLDHLLTLQGYRTAIQDGQATIDEVFAEPTAEAPPSAAGKRSDRLAETIGGQVKGEAPREREPGEEG